ncbi:MAG TPA: RNA methyltransferase [Vicinamibacterales bacterium]|nr:RNA methyltransferase [Vicinamibacterales bacterium]
MRRISSRQNPVVGRFRELARGARAGRVLLDGEHLVDEALAAGVPLEIVALADRLVEARRNADESRTDSGRDARSDGLIARIQRTDAELLRVPDAVMAAISPVKQPSGIVAIAQAGAATLEDALARTPQLVPVLAGVQDAGNVGAIIRAAEGCGATGAVAIEGTADPFGWKALRGAMGSTLRLPIATRQPLATTIVELQRRGVTVAAAVPREGAPLPRCDLRGPMAILLGGEGAGLDASTVAAATLHITIPMRAPVESFNVAITAALILYEAARQRAEI